MPLSDPERTAVELALTLALYRWLISPLIGWCAVRLGAGRYPAVALNGAYPEAPPRAAESLQAGAVVALLSVMGFTVGSEPTGDLALVPAVALALVLWKYLTLDYDAARSLDWQRADRLAVLLAGVAALRWPSLAVLAVVLVCGRLGGWTHHSNVCLRMVKATFCYSLAAGVMPWLGVTLPATSNTTLAVLLGSVYLSHYVTAAWSKARLGPFPWSWMLENRTDLLVASAYSWGWARFVPACRVARIIGVLRRVTVLLNSGTMLVELAGLLAFVNLKFFVFAVAGALTFNCVVAWTSGLLFWENIVIGAVLIAATCSVSQSSDPIHFGVWPWAFSVALMALVLAGWAWRPNILGWWDTPLSAKVLWTVETSDGEVYGLYNDFMSPHDREYARAAGNALVREPLVTFPLGGVEDVAIRDHLIQARPGGDDIERTKSLYGATQWNDERAARHVTYMRDLMTAVNSGRPKSPLPRFLRWFKAPGGHLYYWGDLPRYRKSKGSVSKVTAWYREEMYSSEEREWIRLRNQVLFAVEIPVAGRN
ncbi:hypothetical protein ACIQU1_21590 [Streptomyces angustmyceticus]|uniref:hypothetical protein n=1 Tax=Streptomyces angustmyceticus TaxID=285578 RepID=UPI00381FC757